MEPSRIEKIKLFCNRFTDPVAIINDDFICVYSNVPKLIPKEKSVASFFAKPFELPKDKAKTAMAVIKDNCYGVRIIPFEEGLYVCELFGQNAILNLAENTDLYGKIDPMITSLKKSTIRLWSELVCIRKMLENDNCEKYRKCTLNMENALSGLDSVVSNTYEYIKMLRCAPPTDSYVELIYLAREVVSRCNTLLLTSRRYIDIVSDLNEIIIKAEARFVINAIVNAIQNALLYSPRDDIPCFSISAVGADNSYVLMRFTNSNIMFVNDELNENTSSDFAFQRLGYGIPIIKRFAEMSGGSFSMAENNGRVTVDIIIPIEKSLPADRKKGLLKASRYSVFKTDIPDIVDVKMMEVNSFFS